MKFILFDIFWRPFVSHGKLIEIVVASVWIHSINQCRLHFVDNLGKKRSLAMMSF